MLSRLQGCLVAEHWWLCRMLTMERLEGVPLTDLAAIRAVSSARDPEDILIGALNAWFGSVVACRRFHADVHAGTQRFMLTCMLVRGSTKGVPVGAGKPVHALTVQDVLVEDTVWGLRLFSMGQFQQCWDSSQELLSLISPADACPSLTDSSSPHCTLFCWLWCCCTRGVPVTSQYCQSLSISR